MGESKKINRSSDTAKERLLYAAVKLFAEQGYTETTTRQIAKEAGSSISMLNLHFGSKEELYRKALEHVIDVFALQNITLFGEIIDARNQTSISRETIWNYIVRLTNVLVEIAHDPKYKNEVFLLNRELQNWEQGFQYIEPILIFYYNYVLLFEAYTDRKEDSLWAKELSFYTITGVFRDVCYPELRSYLLGQTSELGALEMMETSKSYHLNAIQGVLSAHLSNS